MSTKRQEKFPASILFIFHFFSFFASRETRKPALFRSKDENFKKTFFRRLKIGKLQKIYRRRRRRVNASEVAVERFCDVRRRFPLSIERRELSVRAFEPPRRLATTKKRRVPVNETRRRETRPPSIVERQFNRRSDVEISRAGSEIIQPFDFAPTRTGAEFVFGDRQEVVPLFSNVHAVSGARRRRNRSR